MSDVRPDETDREYDRLIRLLADGVLGDRDEAALDALLSERPDLRAVYASDVMVHSMLSWELDAGHREAAVALSGPMRPSRSAWRRPAMALAAAVLIAAAAAAVYVATLDGRPSAENDPAHRPVAVLAASTGAVWSSEPVDAGADIGPRTLGIETGTLEIEMHSGAALTLVGPAQLTLGTADRVTLDRGELLARVPHGAIGFTVDAPGGVRVIDLGTVFAVHVADDGELRVRVSQGAVRVERDGAELVRVDRGAAVSVGPGPNGTVRSISADAGDEAAPVVALWRFDGEPGRTPATMPSEVNGELLIASLEAVGRGERPTTDDAVAETALRDPASRPVSIEANGGSLRLRNAGDVGDAATLAVRDGGVVRVADPMGKLRLRRFTVEGFVRIDRAVPFGQIVGVSRGGNGATWALDTGSDGMLRARLDTQAIDAPAGDAGEQPTGFNIGVASTGYLGDGRWHHFAATWDGETRTLVLYVDYREVGRRTLDRELVYDGGDLLIGNGGAGRALDGWIDHVRISAGVLEPARFIAVPQMKAKTDADAAGRGEASEESRAPINGGSAEPNGGKP